MPYPKLGQANGLAFAVNKEVNIPFSLKMIKQEIVDEYINSNLEIDLDLANCQHPNWKTLSHWHKQGVFLLNTALTVKTGVPDSHTIYWREFIEGIVNIICTHAQPIWLLWGAKARDFGPIIFSHHPVGRKTGSRPNRTMSCGHPAAEYHNPGQGGFLGCNHFKKVNDLLTENNEQAINW